MHSTMEELENHDGKIAQAIYGGLERVQELQKGDGVDVVAIRM